MDSNVYRFAECAEIALEMNARKKKQIESHINNDITEP